MQQELENDIGIIDELKVNADGSDSPLMHKSSTRHGDCPICLEAMNDKEIRVIIICSHVFHLECLN